MNHKTHQYLMGGLVLVGAVVLFTGSGGAFGGGGLFLLVFLGFCFAMMFFMMRGMSGGGTGGGNDMGGMDGDARGGRHGTDEPTEREEEKFDDGNRRTW
jgi:hypothetical protein